MSSLLTVGIQVCRSCGCRLHGVDGIRRFRLQFRSSFTELGRPFWQSEQLYDWIDQYYVYRRWHHRWLVLRRSAGRIPLPSSQGRLAFLTVTWYEQS